METIAIDAECGAVSFVFSWAAVIDLRERMRKMGSCSCHTDGVVVGYWRTHVKRVATFVANNTPVDDVRHYARPATLPQTITRVTK